MIWLKNLENLFLLKKKKSEKWGKSFERFTRFKKDLCNYCSFSTRCNLVLAPIWLNSDASISTSLPVMRDAIDAAIIAHGQIALVNSSFVITLRTFAVEQFTDSTEKSVPDSQLILTFSAILISAALRENSISASFAFIDSIFFQ